MKDLLVSIAAGLVDEPEKVTVEVDDINEEGVIVYHLHVAQDDMGRVIGKQGRIAEGSGTNVQQVNRLIKQYEQTKELMKRFTGKGSKFSKFRKSGQLPPDWKL